MMPELKPCPCGKPAGYVGGSSRLDGLLTASIECSTFCGFRVEKSELYKRKDHTPAEMTGFTLLLRHKAIKAWNTRPDGGDSLREALLKLAEAMKPSGYWGQICAWIVNGAPTKNDGIDAAKYIVELQTMASAALAAKDGG